MNLGVGLTFMRKYDFALLGYIYQSFFSLSVGLERLCKLILLYEYFMRKGHNPPSNYLKSKGHVLTSLFSEAASLAPQYGCEKYFLKFKPETVYDLILNNLSDFATCNRYFHLNKLSGYQHSEDPVMRWDKEVNEYIINKHFHKNTPRNNAMIEIAEKISDFSTVLHHDERGKEILNFKDLMEASLKVETKQKYSMFYTFCLVKALCQLQYEQYFVLSSDACLYEFFTIFRTEEKRALKLKTWNPHPPYKF